MAENRVNQEVQRHEKVRFRQEDITCLTTFPSAEGQGHLLARRPVSTRIMRGFGIGAAVAGALLAVLVLAVFMIGMSGLGADRLRREAEAAIQQFAGVDVAATIGPANLSLDSSRFLALEVQDVKFASPTDGVAMVDAGRVRFGVQFWPLMSGRVRLGSATISDARIIPDALPTREGPDWKATLFNPDGLIDPDRVTTVLLEGLHHAFDAMELGSTRSVELDNVEFVLPEGGRMRNILISGARLHQSTDGELSVTAEVEIDARAFSLEGTAKRDLVSKRISNLDLRLTAPAVDAASDAEGTQSANSSGSRIGAVEIAVTGSEGIGSEPSRLSAKINLTQSVLDLGSRGKLMGDMQIAALLATGSGKVEIERLHLTTGRSQFNFQGAIGPAPRAEGELASYRYELVSDDSTVAPEDSPEPALQLLARISGRYDPLKNLLRADQLGIRTGSGELMGTASLEFAEGRAPGITLEMTVPHMPAAHLKQLWPWFAASGARRWVLNNVFGGQVTSSRLHYGVAVGRIGNGIPLNHDEVSGTFNVEGTRFDITGRIPPVRDARGSVDFRGNDIDIALSSGSVFMTNGRSVAASNGKLIARNVNRRPVIGDLDIDITGDADAVAELASYEPINAMRHVGLAPEEFSGKVEGHVKADIPLQKGIDTSTLDWLVSLNYRGLGITKPFDGQKVTGAEGTIVIDPTKAVIAAKAQLNGAPAEIAMIEPINDRGPKRQRDITVTLNDKAREALIPGLGSMLSGPVKVGFSSGVGPKQDIKADLTGAKLNIPWAGWNKGAGIPADVSFALDKSQDGIVKLSGFKLAGKSFAVEGGITLAKGELSSANFDTVRLNRGDDVSLVLRRSGKGYDVDIRGNALDARAVIKQFTAGAEKATQSTGAIPISLSAKIDTLSGFHGEQLSNVKLDYRGIGGKVLGMEVSAVTKSGAAVTLGNNMKGDRRTMDMQSPDAGAILRFLDIYEHMQGGTIKLALAGNANGPLKGNVDAVDFWVVDEPKLRSIVSTAPAGDDRSLNEAVKRDIDTSRVQFERGYAEIEKGDGYLSLGRGVLRGPMIGTTFQGTLYDTRGNMAMTGTFMPAYGLNRLFGELPLVGMILGNGRDRGLIGVTYKLSGDAKSPNLQINPLSVIAPGIFRSIFEYR